MASNAGNLSGAAKTFNEQGTRGRGRRVNGWIDVCVTGLWLTVSFWSCIWYWLLIHETMRAASLSNVWHLDSTAKKATFTQRLTRRGSCLKRDTMPHL